MLTARECFQLAAKRQREKLEEQAKRERAEAKKANAEDKKQKVLLSVPIGYLSLGQIVERYNRAPSGIYRAIQEGKLKSEKLGPYRIVEVCEIERYFREAKDRQKSAAYRAMQKRASCI